MSRRETFAASGFGPPARPKPDPLTPEERAQVERRIREGKVTRVERGVMAEADMDHSIEAQRERGRRIAQRDMKFRRLRQSAEAIDVAVRDPAPSAAAIERMRKTDEELAAAKRQVRAAAAKGNGGGDDGARGLRGGRAPEAALPRRDASEDVGSASRGGAVVVEQAPDAARLAPPTVEGLAKLGSVKLDPAKLKTLPPWRAACAFEMVPVARLFVQPRYQRAMSGKSARRVRRIAEQFDWARFGVIVVARAGDGFEVIDGQTRATAARSRAVREVPALVVSAEGAAVFLGLNRDRANLDAAQLFHAELAAGEAEAAALAEVLGGAGIVVPRARPSRGLRARQTYAVAVLRAELRRHGPEVLGRALRVLADAWGDEAGVFGAEWIRAMCRVVDEIRKAPDLMGPAEDEIGLLIAGMRPREPAELLREAKAAAAEHGGAAHVHLARIVCNAHAAWGGIEIAVGV